MRHTLTLLLVLLFVAACKGDPSGPNEIKAILITPGVVVLTQAGATQAFTAQPVDAGGGTVSGVTVKWRTSNPAIVTIDAVTGIATAVAEGNATIYADASGATGSASVTVDVPECKQVTNVALAVGGILVSDPPANATCALRLPQGVAGDKYRVAIVRLTATQDATAVSATLTITPRGVVTAPPAIVTAAPAATPLLSSGEIAQLESSARIADATAAVHVRLREAEDALLRRVGPFAVPFPSVLAPAGPLLVAPAKKTFLPRASSDASCSTTGKTPVTGLLVSESGQMAVYQDSAQVDSQPVSKANVDKLLEFYAAYGKPTIDSYFGAVPDRDANGQVVVFITPQVANPVAGFVWGGDQLDVAACAASNQMELVYFNAGVINGLSSGNYQAYETLVHEVKHIVSFNHRMIGSFFNSHETWIEEGTAEIAGEVASRKAWAAAKGGPAENATVTRASFNTNPRITPENYGVYLRLIRTREYLSTQPNSVVYGPVGGSYTIYGSGWHFSRFLGDAYGGAATAPGGDAAFFTKQNAASTPPGVLGFESITGKPFDQLLVEYAAAIMLNGTGTPAPARGFTTYNFVDALQAFFGAPNPNYPYLVAGTGYRQCCLPGPIGNAGLRLYEFTSNGTGDGADITVQVDGPAKVVVVRLK